MTTADIRRTPLADDSWAHAFSNAARAVGVVLVALVIVIILALHANG